MSKQVLDEKQIRNKVWAACDTLRHVMDPNEYKDYILTFLFLKYVSDLYESKVEAYRIQYKGDEERVKRRLEREMFVLNDECTFSYIVKSKNNSQVKDTDDDKVSIGQTINNVLHKIQELNFQKLHNVFRGINFNSEAKLGSAKQRKERLGLLIDDFKDIDFKPYLDQVDVVGNIYEFLIEKFAADAGKSGGEFYTPPQVAELLAKLVEPKSGDKIYDPTCGSGSLLIQASKEVKNHDFALYGQEINGTTWALAKMNMFLHGIAQAKIENDDTIKSPKFIENDTIQKFNIVVANPPFSKDKWGVETAENDPYKRFDRGVPPKSKGDWAFITHVVESLLPGGTAGIVVPHGVLFRGASEGKIREALLKENLVHAVIGLPGNLFYGAGISAALLILKKNRKEKDIFFIDASKEFEEGKKQNKLREKDISKIVENFKKRKPVEKYASLVSAKKIAEADYNLNISQYVDSSIEEEEININAVQKQIIKLEEELTTVQAQMKKYLRELGYESK